MSSEKGELKPLATPVAPPASEASPPATKVDDAFVEALKGLPWIGNWLVLVYRLLGWKGLVFFASGLLVGGAIAATLYGLGLPPAILVSEKYKPPIAVATAEKSPELKPPQRGPLELEEVSDETKLPYLLQKDYYAYLLTTAADLKRDHPADDVTLKIEQHSKSFASEGRGAFELEVKARSDYIIETIRAFRVTESNLIELLSNPDDQPTNFNVPISNKADKIVVLMIIRRAEGAETGDTSAIIKATAR
jgi:hypothetical protein